MRGTNTIHDAKRITNAMRRARSQMEANVMLSGDANSLLNEDGELISESLDDHKYHIKSTLSRTRQHLFAVSIAELKEKYGLFFSVAIFTTTSIFIILRRIRFFTLILVVFGKDYASYFASRPNDQSVLETTAVKVMQSQQLNDISSSEKRENLESILTESIMNEKLHDCSEPAVDIDVVIQAPMDTDSNVIIEDEAISGPLSKELENNGALSRESIDVLHFRNNTPDSRYSLSTNESVATDQETAANNSYNNGKNATSKLAPRVKRKVKASLAKKKTVIDNLETNTKTSETDRAGSQDEGSKDKLFSLQQDL